MELRHKEFDEALKVGAAYGAEPAAVSTDSTSPNHHAGGKASRRSEEGCSLERRQGSMLINLGQTACVTYVPCEDDVQNRLYRSTKLWSLCIDLEEYRPQQMIHSTLPARRPGHPGRLGPQLQPEFVPESRTSSPTLLSPLVQSRRQHTMRLWSSRHFIGCCASLAAILWRLRFAVTPARATNPRSFFLDSNAAVK